MTNPDSAVIVSANVREYFHDQVDAALTKQAVKLDDTTMVYVVGLLTTYTQTPALFDETDDGLDIKPLAMHYADALNAASSAERSAALRRLGDVALFISGLFADSLNRKLNDVDYYIAMGGTAYSYVHDLALARPAERNMRSLFAELAEKFTDLVDVLGEVGDRSNLRSNSDVLRLYDLWLKTGSTRAFDRLQRLGLNPSLHATSRTTH
ncbi:MAG: hypothetical protein E2O35_01560 [Proteobacteria bacterium]|nr:MAG: hypothetical protein E2O35_01560 [Pseudomonadota bacterium]